MPKTREEMEEVVREFYKHDDYRFKTLPYEHQFNQFIRHRDEDYMALFDEMGTGKSKISIDIAYYKYLKGKIDAVLIIAPNHVHSQWIKEQFVDHCPGDYVPLIWDSSKVKSQYYQDKLDSFLTPKIKSLKVLAVNVEAFQADSVVKYVARYVKNNKVYTVIDEATKIKTPTAKRSKTILKLEKYGQRSILTGTPATKNPFGLWTMYEFLKHNFFGCNYFMFRNRHGVMMRGVNERTGAKYTTLITEQIWNAVLRQLDSIRVSRGGKLMDADYEYVSQMSSVSESNVKFIDKKRAFSSFKKLDEIKKQIDPVTSFARKKDCLDIPDKVYETAIVEMTKEQRKVYKELKNNMLSTYDESTLTVKNKIVLVTRLMQVCGGFFPYIDRIETYKDGGFVIIEKTDVKMIGTKNAKIEKLKEDMEEQSDYPIIIWATFTAEIRALYEALKNDYKCCLYYGGVPDDVREAIKIDFQNNRYDVMIGNKAAGAYGLNFQNATTQYYFSNDYNVETRLQAEDRSNRLGAKKTCLYRDFVCKHTVDEKIVKSIVAGKALNDFFKKPLSEILSEEEE